MAPDHKFPSQIEHVWQAYTWLILNVKQLFGIDFNKVVIVGDSAGGCLTIALTVMAI